MKRHDGWVKCSSRQVFLLPRKYEEEEDEEEADNGILPHDERSSPFTFLAHLYMPFLHLARISIWAEKANHLYPVSRVRPLKNSTYCLAFLPLGLGLVKGQVIPNVKMIAPVYVGNTVDPPISIIR